jgi:hypothetical protein
MKKTVAFKRPLASPPANADAWIESGKDAKPATPEPPKRMVRFTLDVDAELHSRMKIHCVRQGKPMSDVLRAVLADQFPPE